MDQELRQERDRGRPIPRRGLRVALENLAIVLLWSAFAYSHWFAFLRHPRASGLVLVAFELLFAGCYFVRRDATAVSWSSWDWVTATIGSFLPLLLRPAGVDSDVLVGEILQAAGGVFIAWSVLSLNRSIGIVPANRGVRRAGAYRLVRHPLYSGYMVLQLGYLLSNPTQRNAAILAIAFGCQVARVFNEERLLSRDPEYVAYKQSTRWRILPRVF